MNAIFNQLNDVRNLAWSHYLSAEGGSPQRGMFKASDPRQEAQVWLWAFRHLGKSELATYLNINSIPPVKLSNLKQKAKFYWRLAQLTSHLEWVRQAPVEVAR